MEIFPTFEMETTYYVSHAHDIFFSFLKTALQSLFLFHIKVSDISERVQTPTRAAGAAIIPL